MKRTLTVEVDCEGGTCGECKFLDDVPLCDLFDDPAGAAQFTLLDSDSDDQPERCLACLAAERRAKEGSRG